MLNLKRLVTAVLSLPLAFAYIDQPCNAGQYGEGVCVKKSACVMYAGQQGSAISYVGRAPNWPCPNDPADVICCVKNVSRLRDGKTRKSGRCKNINNCPLSKNTRINTFECPGSDRVKLCVPKKIVTKTTTRKTTKTTKKTTKTATVKPTNFKQHEIIDISEFNPINDYAAAAKNIDGVIMRTGYRGYGSAGTLVKDGLLETHYQGFSGRTKVGYYFFTQATSTAEAEEEANYVVNTLIKGKRVDFPIYWDSEGSGAPGNSGRADGLSKSDRTDCAIAFVKRIKALGYRAGVYASEYWFRDNLDFNRIVNAGASIWVARYSDVAPSTSQYDAWQFTSSGSIPGIPGNVDRSHVYKNVAGW